MNGTIDGRRCNCRKLHSPASRQLAVADRHRRAAHGARRLAVLPPSRGNFARAVRAGARRRRIARQRKCGGPPRTAALSRPSDRGRSAGPRRCQRHVGLGRGRRHRLFHLGRDRDVARRSDEAVPCDRVDAGQRAIPVLPRPSIPAAVGPTTRRRAGTDRAERLDCAAGLRRDLRPAVRRRKSAHRQLADAMERQRWAQSTRPAAADVLARRARRRLGVRLRVKPLRAPCSRPTARRDCLGLGREPDLQ